jgi:3-phenylpropionate/cinnamic acid dioxygenase small subunit
VAVGPIDRMRLFFEINELYTAYVTCLDEGDLERWPDLFTDDCRYACIPRENHERGLPLATVLCESRGMLQDRVVAIRETAVYAPRVTRHLVSSLSLRPESSDVVRTEANYAVFETLVDQETRVLNTGRYLDTVVRADGAWRFREKLCVFDSVLVPNSLIYPL